MSDIAQRLISAAEDFPEIEENPSDLYCAASVEIQHLRARITDLESALRDCVTHMKTAGSPEAVRACEAAERVLSDE